VVVAALVTVCTATSVSVRTEADCVSGAAGEASALASKSALFGSSRTSEPPETPSIGSAGLDAALTPSAPEVGAVAALLIAVGPVRPGEWNR
jgi:hypothetical protein